MKSKHAKYIKERLDQETYEDEKCFFTYEVSEDEMFVRDIYVLPEFRKSNISGIMTEKMKNIAKENKCTTMYGHVAIGANGYDKSVHLLLKHGFNLHAVTDDLVYFKMEI